MKYYCRFFFGINKLIQMFVFPLKEKEKKKNVANWEKPDCL